jgi:hypothetical protein
MTTTTTVIKPPSQSLSRFGDSERSEPGDGVVRAHGVLHARRLGGGGRLAGMDRRLNMCVCAPRQRTRQLGEAVADESSGRRGLPRPCLGMGNGCSAAT